MKRFFKEFKAFINKGSVMDLAVGMIIGSAFTAIVTALVNNILKPLINWIPLSGKGTGLQTVLKEAVTDADGNVVTAALILDWGAVISAIITFILTALVLFSLVKGFNKLKEVGGEAKNKIDEKLDKVFDKDGKEVAAASEAVEPAATETPAPAPAPTTEELLAKIVELLENKEK